VEAFLSSWLSRGRNDRKRALEHTWNLAKKALQSFHAAEEFREYADTYNLLSFAVASSIEFEGNQRLRRKKLGEAAEHGRRAVAIWRSIGDKTELTKALIRASIFLDGLADETSSKILRVDNRRESRRMWKEGMKVSRNVALHEITHPLAGYQSLDPKENLKVCEEALEIVRPTKDNFAIGRLNEFLAKHNFYAAESSGGGDPVAATRIHVKALHYAEASADFYDIINYTSPIAGVLWIHSPYCQHFSALARYESDPDRCALLEEKSLRCIPELLRSAREKGSPRVRFYALYTSYNVESAAAAKEKTRKRQRRLFQRALSHRMETDPLVSRVFARISWNRAVAIRGLADLQSRLANVENDRKKKNRLLSQAIRNQLLAIRVAIAYVRQLEASGDHFNTEGIARLFVGYGDLLSRIEPVGDNNVRKAARAYSTGAEWNEKIPRYDRSAACYWKSAQAYDQIQAHTIAAEYFTRASQAYAQFGRRVPSLRHLARDYSSYLKAWTKIELARSFHAKQQFERAAKSYRQAAELHKSTKRWNLLDQYYQAWSKLEFAEALSRKGRFRAAVKAFGDAGGKLAESKILIKNQLSPNSRPEERAILEKLANSSIDSYCKARANLEEAMFAESQEDYHRSFEKFGLASEVFQETSTLSESAQENREASFLSSLCKAWQLASKAELENSTKPLQMAVSVFERAIRLSPNEKSLKLASGHKAFSEGLITSRIFAKTLDPSLHEEAAKHLQLSRKFYLEAGFNTAAHHATARRLLLDASSLLGNARNAKDPNVKIELYDLANAKLLESSMEFKRAKQNIRRAQVKQILQETTSETKAPLRITDTLTALTYSSTNAAVYTYAQGNEKSFGLERFEQADIEVKTANVGRLMGSKRDVELELEISNIGKQSIKLLRLDDVFPEGSEAVEIPDSWKAQGQSVINGSRVIAPAETEKLKFVLRQKEEGLLIIRPTLVFSDEGGAASERPVASVIVPTSTIFDFLVSSFVKDNATRLRPDMCGWKSKMEIVKDLKIPRSHVYGERRYGRAFGKQLDSLVRASLVEYRIFPKERGRGGNITRVRIQLENENVREYIQELTSEKVPVEKPILAS